MALLNRFSNNCRTSTGSAYTGCNSPTTKVGTGASLHCAWSMRAIAMSFTTAPRSHHVGDRVASRAVVYSSKSLIMFRMRAEARLIRITASACSATTCSAASATVSARPRSTLPRWLSGFRRSCATDSGERREFVAVPAFGGDVVEHRDRRTGGRRSSGRATHSRRGCGPRVHRGCGPARPCRGHRCRRRAPVRHLVRGQRRAVEVEQPVEVRVWPAVGPGDAGRP